MLMSTGYKIKWAATVAVLTLVQAFFWWLIKHPFSIHNQTTYWEIIVWFFLAIGAGLFWGDQEGEYGEVIFFVFGGLAFVAILVFGAFFSSDCFHAKERYNFVSQMVEIINTDENGESPFPNLLGSNNDTSNLPLLGLPEAIKNAETQMGKQPALGSQFELLESEVTSQNINNSLMYVVPLEPKSFLKWDGNNHGYFIVDRNNGNTQFVQEGLLTTEHAPFGSNAIRIVYNYMRSNGIYGRITEFSPEVDDEGNFKYVATVYDTTGIEGLRTVRGIVELDAMTKQCKYYGLDEIPDYVDRVFPEEIFDEYLRYYGKYKNGWLNSFIGQKEVLEPTEGSDIVYIDGICYYYTGFTSAGKGESSNGIIMMNCRTGEIKYYVTYGISEEKAMGVAEGRVQEKGYNASYPLLLMVSGQETYFMLMRDEANNLCGYAFVSYKDYTKAAVSETLSTAQAQYIKAVSTSNSADVLDNLDTSTGKAKITAIGSEVRDGVTIWYVMMEGNDHIFTLTSEVEPMVVFARVGDIAEISYIEAESTVVSAITFDIKIE